MKYPLLAIILLIASETFSQDTTIFDSKNLRLKIEREDGKTLWIEHNSKIKLFCGEKKLEGRYQVLDKENIILENETIHLTDVDIIGFNNIGRKITGMTFLSTGIITPIASIIYDATQSPFLPSIIYFAPIGLAQILFGTGHLGFKRRYKLERKWNLSLEKP
jgi:hypothetical protein